MQGSMGNSELYTTSMSFAILPNVCPNETVYIYIAKYEKQMVFAQMIPSNFCAAAAGLYAVKLLGQVFADKIRATMLLFSK